jgi:hypothetical protein
LAYPFVGMPTTRRAPSGASANVLLLCGRDQANVDEGLFSRFAGQIGCVL